MGIHLDIDAIQIVNLPVQTILNQERA
jgi:hypothetical protein